MPRQDTMHYDPWAVSSEDGAADTQDNELDLTDCFADESVPATPYIQSGPGWITQTKARVFIHGFNRPIHEVHAQAYRALRAHNTVEPHLGLDRSSGQCCIDDVRSQPIDSDEGYEAAEQNGRGPRYPEIIQYLLQFRDRIQQKDMVYLIVDNRDPGEVPYWPAFEK